MSYPQRPLGEVLQLHCDAVEVRADNTYKIAGVYSFGRGLFERESIAGVQTQYRYLHRLHAGAVVLSKLKAFEGAIAVIQEEFEGRYLSPEFPTFMINSSAADARYIHYLCSWRQLWERLAQKSTGIGSRRERVSPGQLQETLAPLPDLAEQRRIAAKLDAVMGKLKQISDLQARSSNLRDAFLQSVFNKLRGETHRTMSDLVEFERLPVGLQEKKEYVQIGVRSFGRGIFHRPAVRPDELSKLKYFKIIPGRLIVSNIMAWEGAVALSKSAEAGCIGSSRFLSFVPKNRVNPAYLNYYFRTHEGRLSIASASTGTVKRNQTLSVRNFERIAIPVPDVEVQNEVVRMIDLTELRIHTLEQSQSDNAKSTRTALLDAAFTGRL
ncbi:restriction endonuclease subunit S [Nocardia sp. NPDC051787]|uniref:restriction endonuclease subunit S n=1 Tax=Nocardia sp. NPDC051787 TaxID=3155415 RepID=UPI003423BE94